MSQKAYTYNKRSDWDKGIMSNLKITNEGLTIVKKNQLVFDKQIYKKELSLCKDFIDVAVDEKGIVYILDKDLNLWRYDVTKNTLLLKFGDGFKLFTSHSMIKIVKGLLIIADPNAEKKLIAISLENGQVVWTLNNTEENLIIPLAFTVNSNGDIFIISPVGARIDNGKVYIPENCNMMIVNLDFSGVVKKVFGKEDIEKPDNSKINLLRKQYFIKSLSDKGICLLETETKKIKIFTTSGKKKKEITLKNITTPFCIETDKRGVVYIGESSKEVENQQDIRTIKMFDLKGEYLGECESCQEMFDKILIRNGEKVFVFNFSEPSITVLMITSCFYGNESTENSKCIYITPLFDSFDKDTVWHRFVIEANIPIDTQLRISHFTCDIDSYINQGIPNICDFFESELSHNSKINKLEELWMESGINHKDSMIFSSSGDALIYNETENGYSNSSGQYFYMKIEFIGTSTQAPTLKELKVIYPRMSYVRYLPGIYQQWKNNLDFLERFLSIFETDLMEMENKIDNIAKFFDIDCVNGEIVTWLGSWLGIDVDSSWDEKRLKRLIRNAPDLYKRRGTSYAIKRMIKVYTGEEPIIIEYFKLNGIENECGVKKVFENLYGTNEFAFYVLLEGWKIKNETEQIGVKRIISSQKPAHTDGVLVLLQQGIYLDKFSYLNVNSYLPLPTELRIEDNKSIPNNTVLSDSRSLLEINSEINMDLKIN